MAGDPDTFEGVRLPNQTLYVGNRVRIRSNQGWIQEDSSADHRWPTRFPICQGLRSLEVTTECHQGGWRLFWNGCLLEDWHGLRRCSVIPFSVCGLKRDNPNQRMFSLVSFFLGVFGRSAYFDTQPSWVFLLHPQHLFAPTTLSGALHETTIFGIFAGPPDMGVAFA